MILCRSDNWGFTLLVTYHGRGQVLMTCRFKTKDLSYVGDTALVGLLVRYIAMWR